MKIKIIFSTQGGTTEFVAGIIKDTMAIKGHDVTVEKVSGIEETSINGFELVIFGSPTYDMGNIDPSMESWLQRNDLNLTGIQCAVFALGDSSFPHFCTAADKLEAWVINHHGVLVEDSLKLDSYTQQFSPTYAWVTTLVERVSLKS